MDTYCQEVLENSKNVINNGVVAENEYLDLVKKYKEVCNKNEKMVKKEREKNQKFLNAQKTLKDDHEEAIYSLKNELKDLKRELNKSQNRVPEKVEASKEPEKIIEITDSEKVIIEKYSKEKTTEILNSLINDLSKTALNFKKISITYFEENKLVFLQKALSKTIQAEFEKDSPTLINQITNNILKENFKYIHEVFAEKVLEASDVTRGIFKFFENHVIEDSDQTRWNTFAITRFMNEYMTHTGNVAKLKADIQKLEEKRFLEKENEKKLTGGEQKEELKKSITENKKIERFLHLCEVKKTESEIELRRINKQYLLLSDATTKFLMQTRVVK